MSNVTPNGHGTGRRRDDLDPRDWRWANRSSRRVTALPASTNNRQWMQMPFLNQGQLGSCTANSMSYVFDYERIKAGLPPLGPSRLKQYFNTRVLEGTVESDSGASIRNTIAAAAKWGMAPENMWPYDIARFRERPPEAAYTVAERNQVALYYRLNQDKAELMDAHAKGFLVTFGFMVFSGFDNLGPSGIVPMPKPGERPLSGHSQVSVDYDTSFSGLTEWLTWNTWGTAHGDGGKAHFPEAFILNPQYCDDFWAVELVEREEPAPPAPPPTPPTPPAPPTPPPTTYNVGPGVLRLMAQLGDRPKGHEKYYPQGPFSKSITEGELYFYEWEELTDTVKATPNSHVIVGTR